MKNDPLISTLVGVLAFGALVAVGLDVAYVNYSRQVRALQPQAIMVNQRRQLAMALRAEVIDYGKQHPDIIEFISGKPVSAPPAPTTKPAPKK
jgi:hypothetical protein